MSWNMMEYAEHWHAKCCLAEISVLGALARQLPKDAEAGSVYPVTIRKLALRLRKDERLVARKMQKLLTRGILLRDEGSWGIASYSEVVEQDGRVSAPDTGVRFETGHRRPAETGERCPAKPEAGVRSHLKNREKTARAGASPASSGGGAGSLFTEELSGLARDLSAEKRQKVLRDKVSDARQPGTTP